jgi:DNA-binding IclR family transcriptional regulator
MNYAAPAAACAADVLELLARSGRAHSVTEMSRALETSRSLVFRVVRELEARSLLRATESGRYWLGLGALEIGGAFVAHVDHADSARRVLRELSARTGETSNLGVLSGSDVLYLMKQDGPNSVMTISYAGKRLPANCTALGKALLAALPDREVRGIFGERCPRLTPRSITSTSKLLKELSLVRERGYAIDNGETILGRCCVAMRVEMSALDAQAAAVSVSSSSDVFRASRAEFIAAARHACEQLTRESVARDVLGSHEDSFGIASVG